MILYLQFCVQTEFMARILGFLRKRVTVYISKKSAFFLKITGKHSVEADSTAACKIPQQKQ